MIPPKTRDVVWERANSCCEKCGRGLLREHTGWSHVHHRKFRSQGGPDTISNLVLLCPEHHDWCHGPDRAEAEADGFVVPRDENPQFIAIVHWSGELRVLLPDASYGEIVWEAS